MHRKSNKAGLHQSVHSIQFIYCRQVEFNMTKIDFFARFHGGERIAHRQQVVAEVIGSSMPERWPASGGRGRRRRQAAREEVVGEVTVLCSWRTTAAAPRGVDHRLVLHDSSPPSMHGMELLQPAPLLAAPDVAELHRCAS